MSRFLATVTVLTLAACAPPGPPLEFSNQDVALAPAELPQLQVGDLFESTMNGEPWSYEVTEIETNGMIHFAGDDGRTWQQASADFLVPVSGWQNVPSSGSGSHEVEAGQMTGLWPLEPGRSVTFREKGTSDNYPEGWDFNWTCSVLGPAQITVLEVVYDTFPIECKRDDGKRTRIRYYSPDVQRAVYDKNCHKTNGCRVYTTSREIAATS